MDDETVTAIERAVLDVPGVSELYSARPTFGSAIATARSIASRTQVARVVLDGDVLRVVIGTDGSRPARSIASAAHVAALEAAAGHGLRLGRVDVRVARVGCPPDRRADQ